ncbi:hypothetical protein BDN72DRAFT_881553 [Pluteus cervinus]|uniref:Uncharacterized protein n=1 Tax=Pluteus cervinus TaxID=181527 RepID=A0ACD3AF34_9AGAR|nr:hypothetical protein BDN72DRAFT_881553 [Pluteus cervinus]
MANPDEPSLPGSVDTLDRYPAPKAAPNWEKDPFPGVLDALKAHLQTAVLLESYTIPMYLFAYYSIKDPDANAKKILRISKEEMLHLGLAGNILRSIGGTPSLHQYAPEFPQELFYDKVKLNLKPATKETIETFVAVERPGKMPVDDDVYILLKDYKSIGEFYKEVKKGIRAVAKRKSDLFDPTTAGKQFKQGDGSWHAPEMKAITDVKSAICALELIIVQGEGSIEGDEIECTDLPTGEPHFTTFSNLLGSYNFKVTDVVENIDSKYYKDEKFYEALIACDAIYSYLLLSIEKLWQYDPGNEEARKEVIGKNVRGLMAHALGPLAKFLVKQPLSSNAKKFAAPPFRKYNFTSDKLALGQLEELMRQTVAKYANDPEKGDLEKIQKSVKDLVSLDKLK